jgi:ankyrin repeat protein
MTTALREEGNLQRVFESASVMLVNHLSTNGCPPGCKFLNLSPKVSEKVVEVLLDNGADVNTQGGKYGNALQAASHMGNDKVVKMLLKKGADVNAPAGFHASALDAASAGGHRRVEQILGDHQANLAREDRTEPAE